MTSYTKTAWAASTAPGISAVNMNNLETQYDCFMSAYSTSTPLIDSTTGATGTSTAWIRGDHVHPVQNLFLKSAASDTLRLSADSTYTTTSTTATVLTSLYIPPHIVLGGTIRLKTEAMVGTANFGAIYYGGAVSGGGGTLSTTYTIYTDNLTITASGRVYLYGYVFYNTITLSAKNFRVYADTTMSVPPSSWA